MGRDATAEEENEIIAKRRHQELIRVLQAIPVPSNKEIVEAITKQSEFVNSFYENIVQVSNAMSLVPVVPQVEMNLSELTSLMNSMCEMILKGQRDINEELKLLNTPKSYSFEVIKGSNGSIERVIATPVIKKYNLQDEWVQ